MYGNTGGIARLREVVPQENKRGYARYYVNIPIAIQMPFHKDFQQGIACNVCKDGMYLQTPYQLRPDTHLYVKREPMEDVCTVQTHPVYMTNVRWMKLFSKGDIPMYGSGVQYTLKGHLFVSESPHQEYVCDFCGKRALAEIHVTEDQTYFCEDCFKKIGALGNAHVRDCFLRYSMGNVC